MEKIRGKCGIAAVSLPEGKDASVGGAAYYLYKMLLQQQHRGQSSAGITTYNSKRARLIDTYKELGMVNEVFRSHHAQKNLAILNAYSGSKGIGHVRYATSGSDEDEDAQPFERRHGRLWKWFSFAFNGNIANFAELKEGLRDSGYHLVRDVDTELMMHFISKQLIGGKKRPVEEIFHALSQTFDGSYNIAYLDAEGRLVVARDPLGFKPVCFLGNEGIFAAASESCALESFSENGFKDVKPGELVLAENGSFEARRFAKSGKKAHCMFEWVYFANPSSVLDGKNVYQARWDLGAELAKNEFLETGKQEYVVVPVPDTSRPAADGYANTLGLVSMEGLLRNRYVGRTFIEGSDRHEKARQKYSVNKAIVSGKKIILVDDSIVRGTTSKSLVEYIRKVGKPEEIHLRVSSPPIRCPCFYGIDMSTLQELIAPKHLGKEGVIAPGKMDDVPKEAVEAIGKELGVDSLQFQTIGGLVRAIGLDWKDLCLACLTGHYPTESGQSLIKKAVENRAQGCRKRTYS